jgi:DNA-directed RNA polymerase alpha subunit
MNPSISKISEENGVYKFTLSGLNVSLANAIRRTILSDIPTLVFYTETYNDNKCNILVNTSRFHNEIIKQRLSCIPIHMKELDLLPDKYILEVDVKNDTDSIIYVTTEDFRVRNKTNDNYLTQEETRRIFPPCPSTNYFIDFVRLRPKIGDSIPGEHLKLTCDFSVSNAKVNSMFNVVSKCTYSNSIDREAVDRAWETVNSKLIEENMPEHEIEFQKKNFKILDAQRIYIPDSFDFTIQTLGVYENNEIVKFACNILKNKLNSIVDAINSDMLLITKSENTIEHSYDITLENEDYTIGKVLEYILYEKYYMTEQILSYCGFKKMHPHDTDSIIRIAYFENLDKNMVREHLRIACNDAIEVFEKVYRMF